MKIFLMAAAAALVMHSALEKRDQQREAIRQEAAQKAVASLKNTAVGCSPRLDQINFADSAQTIPLLQGWGSYRMPVTHARDSAYEYFQQGINLYYGFHIIEALASFEKCLQFDPAFAMGYWGKALAYGPNINDVGYSASPEALEATRKAKAFSGSCSEVEKALIEAMQVRYSEDTLNSREALNQRYADAMHQVHTRFPDHADAAALYADALMIQHPWDLYDRYYQPKPWTPAIVAVLEKLVKQFPDHPGAAHYYIHAVEGSTQPEKALAVADRLGPMMPGVAHLVHMPSHIYIRTGQYQRGVEANHQAIRGYRQYLDAFQPSGGNAFLYLMHNLHMQAACAMMDGQSATAMRQAGELQQQIGDDFLDAGGYFGVYGQYLHHTSLLVLVRFGQWKAILETPELPGTRVYAALLRHFARGMAFVRTQQINEARMELDALKQLLTHPQLLESPAAFNPGKAGALVAESLLAGTIAAATQQPAAARRLMEDAVDREEGMLYNEPRDWLLPARQYLGQFLLQTGDLKTAEQVFRQDLRVNPANLWSLTGLQQALQQQGRKAEAAKVQQELTRARSRADVPVKAPVF